LAVEALEEVGCGMLEVDPERLDVDASWYPFEDDGPRGCLRGLPLWPLEPFS
jgi:hypothetical protein